MTKEVMRPAAYWGSDQFLRHFAVPSTDVWSEGSQVYVRIQLPGFAQDDVSVNLEAGDLVIQAHHQESEKDSARKYVVRETTNSFYRRVRLPEYAEAEKVAAEFDQGVLTITVPLGSLPESTSIPITAPSEPKG